MQPATAGTTHPAARDRLFVALDTSTVDAAARLVERLGSTVKCYKIGLELLFGGGLDFALGLKSAGKTIFLDVKLLDISNTVEKATANIARLGLDYLTVHGHDRQTLDSAVRGRGNASLKLLAVTVLTNLEAADLHQQGVERYSPEELVVHRARLAMDAGCDGVIASGREAATVRSAIGPERLIVTPGIRMAGQAAQDQARVMTPGEAIAAGATHLVVGRPISGSDDPKAAAERVIREMEMPSAR